MAKFRYWNENPQGEHHNDCVTRAITLASGLPYSKIRKKLFHTAKLLDCSKLCWSCYSFLLSDVLGYRQVNCDGMTIGEFADLHPKGTYLIRIDGHLTIIINNTLYDTFDCRNSYCDIVWRVA
jgi:hypothetical protein